MLAITLLMLAPIMLYAIEETVKLIKGNKYLLRKKFIHQKLVQINRSLLEEIDNSKILDNVDEEENDEDIMWVSPLLEFTQLEIDHLYTLINSRQTLDDINSDKSF